LLVAGCWLPVASCWWQSPVAVAKSQKQMLEQQHQQLL